MEIEIKAKVEDLPELQLKLVKLGCVFSKPKIQADEVWVKKTGDLDDFLDNEVFLRLRCQNDKKVILTAKKSKHKTGDQSLIKHEFEVVVDSIDEARGLLGLLGFKPAVQISKQRQTAHYRDFEICLDQIDGLGSFIELEKIGHEDAADKIQMELIAFLAELGISPSNKVNKGYDILMLEMERPRPSF